MQKYYSKKVDDPVYGHFDSTTEFEYFKVLLRLQENGVIKDLDRQEEFLLIPSFKDSSSNTVLKMTYASDFTYVDIATNKKVIVDCKGSAFSIDEKFKVKWKLLKYLQKEDKNIQHQIVIKYKDKWYDLENKIQKKEYKTLHAEENKKKAERKAKREEEKKLKAEKSVSKKKNKTK
jgi:hypothetical protein